jgi:hypothetical protein
MSRSTRIRRSEDAWRRLLCEQQASGLSQRDFCRRRGLGLSTFQKYRRRLTVEPVTGSPDSTSPWFVPLPVEEPMPVATETESPRQGLCLQLRWGSWFRFTLRLGRPD